jgi:SSS family solute:Na+ symporter
MAANFWRAWWAWLICFVVTILVSLVTTRKPEGELIGLVKGLTPASATDSVPWFKRPMFFAILSLLVVIALNIYFW